MSWLNWPNRITIARILLVVPLVICLLNLREGGATLRYAALGLMAALGLSDALDGYLARRFGQETALGRFLDPIADKLLIICAVVLLSLPGSCVEGFRLPNWVPVIAIGKDLLVIIGFLLVYHVAGQVFVEPRPLGKATTLTQLVMMSVVLLAPDLPTLLQRGVPLLWWMASILAVLATADYLWVGNRFASRHMEPK